MRCYILRFYFQVESRTPMHCNGESPCSDQNVLRSHILIELYTSHLFYIHISNEWVINAFLPSIYRANIICIEKKTLLRTLDSFLHFISVGWCNIYIFLPTRCPFELIMIHAGLMWWGGGEAGRHTHILANWLFSK